MNTIAELEEAAEKARQDWVGAERRSKAAGIETLSRWRAYVRSVAVLREAKQAKKEGVTGS